MKNSKTAFTLSELLVSLAVLGLIAALTLPGLFQSVDANKRNSILKETIQAIQSAFYECVGDGTCSSGNFNGLFPKLRLNRECTAAANDTACRTAGIETEAANQSGGIFSSGAYFWGFNRTETSANQTFLIDWNGTQGPNAVGTDILYMSGCFAETTANTACSSLPTANRKHGIIGPVGGASVTLYNSLFQ